MPLEAEAEPAAPSTPTTPTSPSSPSTWGWLKNKGKELVIGGSSRDAASWGEQTLAPSFFDLSAANAKGETLDFKTLAGRVCIVVNVASL